MKTTRRRLLTLLGAAAATRIHPSFAADLGNIAPQPYFEGVRRAVETLAKLGAPVATVDADEISALARQNDSAAIGATEGLLDRYTLVRIAIEPDGYPRATKGGAQRELLEQGWRLFLIRVFNPIGSRDKLTVSGTGQAFRVARPPETINVAPYIANNWLVSQLYDGTPMTPFLSGFGVEYRVIQLFSRDRGKRSAYLNFSTTNDWLLLAIDLPHKGVELDFDCLPSREVTLGVLDADGRGCVASLTIKDNLDRIYPLQTMRLAPDLPFQPQIYRADGETMRLPDGQYTVESKRGPEYLRGLQTVTIDSNHSRIGVKLQRWIDPAKWGWYSGDTHIHAAGCSHYDYPTEGVSPQTIIRQVRGEALSIGEVLTWGPGYLYQKQFFTGLAESPPAGLEHAELQVAKNVSLRPHSTPEDHESVIRYDIETSGFPSSHAGHLVLLRLKDQYYPGAGLLEDWPSWNLPILKWAKAQGAVVGGAHCGHGMVVESRDLPNWEIPAFDGTGTNEGIIDVTHGVFDFLSGCDYPPLHELNAWYHMLNCGFRLAMLGETDFPCMHAERPGVGRSYIHLDSRPVDDAGYDAWVRNLQRGRLYCGDGRSHFIEFRVNGHARGDQDVELSEPGTVEIVGKVAVRLEPEVTPETRAIKTSSIFVQPFWHVERARVGDLREVPVEVVVNGSVVHTANLLADGVSRAIGFNTKLVRSSWVALRILYSGHTHPIFVRVNGLPIRSSKRSALWCRACVDKVWEVKSPFMRESERPAAAEAFEHARAVYDQIIAECESE